MSTFYDYAWWIDGRRIAIVQRGTATQTYSPDEPLTQNAWLTPTAAATNAIILEYTCTLTAPTAETSTIDVDALLSLAIVDYVKFRMAEDKYMDSSDPKDRLQAKHWYGEFRRKISESQENKIAGVRAVIPSGVGVM